MKALKLAVCLLLVSGFVAAQDVAVQGNTKLNTDFKKYKTFSWTQTDKTAQPEGGYYIYTYTESRVAPTTKAKDKKVVKTNVVAPYGYSYDVIIPSSQLVVNTAIQASVKDELEARGYRMSEAQPDLLVAYRVLERQARMKGYVNDMPTMVGSQEVREPSDTTTHTLQPGTLLISLIDAKTHEVVWDGFASGLVRDNVFITEEAKIKEAVHLIMEEFKYRGDKVNKVN
jgi:hypothetical protein